MWLKHGRDRGLVGGTHTSLSQGVFVFCDPDGHFLDRAPQGVGASSAGLAPEFVLEPSGLDRIHHIGYMPARNGCGGRSALRFSPPLDGRCGRVRGLVTPKAETRVNPADRMTRCLAPWTRPTLVPPRSREGAPVGFPRGSCRPRRWRGMISRAGDGWAREPARRPRPVAVTNGSSRSRRGWAPGRSPVPPPAPARVT